MIPSVRPQAGERPPEADLGRGSVLVDSVSMSFSRSRGRKVFDALYDVSLSIAAGEFVALVGPSGCGKSTLLKVAAGLLTPTRGSVTISDAPVVGPRRSVGIMFQLPQLFPWRTVLSNILLPVDVFGRSRKDYEGRARELLRAVGLDEQFATAYPKELSGGMQQRVALCRVLIADPEIILMDEPFAAVDELTRERLDSQLLDVWSTSQKTVLFVTHNIAEAAFLADRVVVMG
ncbi:MAG: ABC transporter ATP-binding protein, partial [Acidimicrobiales bacterium]